MIIGYACNSMFDTFVSLRFNANDNSTYKVGVDVYVTMVDTDTSCLQIKSLQAIILRSFN